MSRVLDQIGDVRNCNCFCL